MIRVCLPPGGRAKNSILNAVPSNLTSHVAVDMPRWRDIPSQADLVVHVGKGAETTAHRMFAANRGAMLVHLPEAYEWLQQRIRDAISEGEDLVILDAGLLTMKVAA